MRDGERVEASRDSLNASMMGANPGVNALPNAQGSELRSELNKVRTTLMRPRPNPCGVADYNVLAGDGGGHGEQKASRHAFYGVNPRLTLPHGSTLSTRRETK